MSHKILVVEDDLKTANVLKMYLEREQHQVTLAHDGRKALDLARQIQLDLIILDLMLPLIDGLDICRILRSESRVPIIMLTAKTTESDKLLGLDNGADDYVTKPFSPREVVARVRAVLRRVSDEREKSPSLVRFGDVVIDFEGHVILKNRVAIHLTPREFRLLKTLVFSPGRVFSRQELIDRVFGVDYEGLDHTVDVHMMNLRKKVEPNPAKPVYLQTVYGVGYKFVGEHYDL